MAENSAVDYWLAQPTIYRLFVGRLFLRFTMDMTLTYSTHTHIQQTREARTGVNALGEIRKTRKSRRQRHKQEQVVIHLVRQERAGIGKESTSITEGFRTCSGHSVRRRGHQLRGTQNAPRSETWRSLAYGVRTFQAFLRPAPFPCFLPPTR